MIAVKLNSFGKLPILGRGEVYTFLEVWFSIFNVRGSILYNIVTQIIYNPNRKD